MLYGIIDIGSNTVRLAIYQIKDGRAEMLMKKKHLVGLAEYVEKGVMRKAGIDRAVEILEGFKAFLGQLSIRNVVAFTTAALRNASNSRAAVREIEMRTGIPIRVISGEAEAEYDFIGAVHGLSSPDGILVDIGGASTEIVLFEGHAIKEKASLPMGSLAFRTEFVQGFLPRGGEIAQMREEAERILATAEDFEGIKAASIVGIGGTFKGADALYHEVYGGGRTMMAEKLADLVDRFSAEAGLTEEKAAQLMRAVPERMHTIITGLIIADTIARHFGSRELAYSDSGVREGYIYAEILKEK